MFIGDFNFEWNPPKVVALFIVVLPVIIVGGTAAVTTRGGVRFCHHSGQGYTWKMDIDTIIPIQSNFYSAYFLS